MIAMQYTIPLAMNFDIRSIYRRVEERATLFEDLPGLSHKSYLLCEEDRLYAPFYIWDNIHEAQNFMLDHLFRGVIETFSRPRIRTWFILLQQTGSSPELPTYALQEMDAIAPEENLEALVATERKRKHDLLQHDGLHSYVVALDPDRWEIMRYGLWANADQAVTSGADRVQSYKVLHVS